MTDREIESHHIGANTKEGSSISKKPSNRKNKWTRGGSTRTSKDERNKNPAGKRKDALGLAFASTVDKTEWGSAEEEKSCPK